MSIGVLIAKNVFFPIQFHHPLKGVKTKSSERQVYGVQFCHMSERDIGKSRQ